jgi:hypothetical protein
MMYVTQNVLSVKDIIPSSRFLESVSLALIPLAHIVQIRKSHGSAVGIAIGYGLDGRGVGVRVPVGSSKSYRHGLVPTQPPIQWVPGALSPGIKRQGREADKSPPASAEVKKTLMYTAPPHSPSWRRA